MSAKKEFPNFRKLLALKKMIKYCFVSLLCRIDLHHVIKVSDFGLTEDIYVKNYFQQGKESNAVKLPVKWMSLESLHDGIFSEKSDVVCWSANSNLPINLPNTSLLKGSSFHCLYTRIHCSLFNYTVFIPELLFVHVYGLRAYFNSNCI